MLCVLACDMFNVFVCLCVVLSGVFVYVCDCGLRGLLMCLCVVCEDCVMLHVVMLLEWCLCV